MNTIYLYHTSNSHECIRVNEKGLPAACSLQRAIFCTTSHVRICISTTRKSVLGTTSHMSVSECAMKSNFIIITIEPSYTAKYHLFVAIGIVTHATHL